MLSKLNEAGVRTYAFVGPLLPHFRFAPDELRNLLIAIKSTGTTELYVELMNMSQYIRSRTDDEITKAGPIWLDAYRNASDREHRKALSMLVSEMTADLGLRVRLGGVLDHVSDAKGPTVGGDKVKAPS